MDAVSAVVASGLAVVLGGLLTLVGQWMSDRRSRGQKAAEAAADRYRLLADEERRNLYEIQDQMVELSDAVLAGVSHAQTGATLSHVTHRLRALLERIPDQEIRALLVQYVDAKQHEVTRTDLAELRDAQAYSTQTYVSAQQLIGSAIRRLDVRDAN
ncbi:MAG: hypothetical protein ABW000_10050 [Actinoplanes sp.]